MRRVWQHFNKVKRENPEGPDNENLFCLGGRIMMGPAEKAWQPLATAHLVAVPITIFAVFECAVSSDFDCLFAVPIAV